MSASTIYRATGCFSSSERVAEAVRSLLAVDFPKDQISLIAKRPETIGTSQGEAEGEGIQVRTEDSKVAETAAKGAAAGGLAGIGLASLELLGVVAPTFSLIPGVGPIIAVGGLATSAVTTVAAGAGAGAAGGAAIGGLAGLSIPEDSVREYHDAIASGKYLTILEGTESQLARVREALDTQEILGWQVFTIRG